MTIFHPASRRLSPLPIAAMLAVLLVPPAAAGAQEVDLDALFPRTLAGLERIEVGGEKTSLSVYSRVQGSVPAGRHLASYSDGTVVRLVVEFRATGRGFVGLFGSEDEAVLALAHDGGPMSAELTPATAAGHRVYRGQEQATIPMIDGFDDQTGPDFTEILVAPLRGHALLRLKDWSPVETSGDLLAAALGELQIDAFRSAAAAHAEVGRHLWAVAAALPATVAGVARASVMIESDGERRGPEIVVAVGYGERTDDEAMGHPGAPMPEFVVVAAVDASNETTARQRMGIEEGVRTGTVRALRHGDRDAFLSRAREPSLAVVEEHAALMLFPTAPDTPDAAMEALLAAIDVEPFFHAAAEYRADAPALAAAAAVQDIGHAEAPRGAADMRLVSWARVIEPDLLGHVLEVAEEHVLFRKGHPQLARVELMDVLVAPEFLRRVVQIEDLGETIRFTTVQAGLEEILW